MIAGVSFAVQSILAKTAYARGADVSTVLLARFVVGTLAVWLAIGWLKGRGTAPGLRQPRARLAGLAVLGGIFATNALTGYLALDYLPAGTTTLLIYVFPALVVLWSRLLFGERLTAPKALALGLALLGCALTVDPATAFGASAGLSWVGVAWALGSALSNSWYTTLSGPLGRGISGLTGAAYSMPITAAVFAVWSAVRLAGGEGAPRISAGGWLAMIAIGLLAAVAIWTLLAGVARIGPSLAAIAVTSEPAAAVILGAIVLGEEIVPISLLGGGCIVAALIILARTSPAAPARS